MKKIFENWNRFILKESGYHMSHRPPSPEIGAPIYDLTLNGVYPKDVYFNGERYYGVGDGSDSESWKKVYSLKGKPNQFVKIYRAVPEDVHSINSGDWVTISKQYAIDHGEGMPEGYKILETKVLAKRLFTNGDSILEWGYWHDGNA